MLLAMSNYVRIMACVVVSSIALLGCSSEADNSAMMKPLLVVHTESTNPPPEMLYTHVWYYRTEVRNLSNKPLKIVWFEAYNKIEGVWYPGNINGRTLRGSEFSEWYTEGDVITDGIIPPGGVAVCDSNWHGSDWDEPNEAKWSFIAIDKAGNDYFIEVVVSPDVLTHIIKDDDLITGSAPEYSASPASHSQ
jgi:hypothetical protein